jgi:ABC-type Fe3+/spermidine/putrescine transport system ATPase subunit
MDTLTASPATPSAASTNDIELEEVTKQFGPVTAVDGVSLAIGAGEFFSFLGVLREGCPHAPG